MSYYLIANKHAIVVESEQALQPQLQFPQNKKIQKLKKSSSDALMDLLTVITWLCGFTRTGQGKHINRNTPLIISQ